MTIQQLLSNVLLVTGFLACNTAPIPDPRPEVPPSMDHSRCFRSVTTAVDGSYSDTMSIALNFSNGNVEGRMDRLPGMKDSMRGTLKGTMHEGRITAIYTYSAEGVDQQEERLLELGPKSVTLLSGEMEERDGMWVMKDPSKAVAGMTVPEVECP